MRADWMASGACTSGSIERRRDATRMASGGAATTSTPTPSRTSAARRELTTHGFPTNLLRRLGAAVRGQRGVDDRLVRVDVGDGRNADARRLDDVDGLDADARPVLVRRR